ncbi:MAG: transposon-encoded TnpW family protein [Eubacterium sp.]|nr:transposon-encoded TnpW family protein [Eubacterium sp.]
MENRKAHTPVALRKQIGGTTYVVRVHFNEDAKETMKDKIKRMLENDVKTSQNTA